MDKILKILGLITLGLFCFVLAGGAVMVVLGLSSISEHRLSADKRAEMKEELLEKQTENKPIYTCVALLEDLKSLEKDDAFERVSILNTHDNRIAYDYDSSTKFDVVKDTTPMLADLVAQCLQNQAATVDVAMQNARVVLRKKRFENEIEQINWFEKNKTVSQTLIEKR